MRRDGMDALWGVIQGREERRPGESARVGAGVGAIE